MAKPRVFVTREIFAEEFKRIQAVADAELWPDELPPSREILLKKSKGVDGILCLLTDKMDAEFMDNAGKQLKVISQIAVGFDHIDIPEATKRGIPVGNTPDVLTHATADATWALLLAASRRYGEAERAVRSGKWRTWHPLHFMGPELYGATIGIIGMGRIGFEVAKRSAGFNMKVIYNDVNRREDLEKQFPMKYVDMDTVLKESDFVSLHTWGGKSTYHLIDDKALGKMKKTAVLVNAARGPVVDPKALYTALKNGTIFSAGLDVTEPEPIPMSDPLLTLENCLIVPHIASATTKARKEMSRISAQNLINGIKGEKLLTCVNPDVYKK